MKGPLHENAVMNFFLSFCNISYVYNLGNSSFLLQNHNLNFVAAIKKFHIGLRVCFEQTHHLLFSTIDLDSNLDSNNKVEYLILANTEK